MSIKPLPGKKLNPLIGVGGGWMLIGVPLDTKITARFQIHSNTVFKNGMAFYSNGNKKYPGPVLAKIGFEGAAGDGTGETTFKLPLGGMAPDSKKGDLWYGFISAWYYNKKGKVRRCKAVYPGQAVNRKIKVTSEDVGKAEIDGLLTLSW